MKINKIANSNFSTRFNQALYGLFILLAVYQLFVAKDYINAASSMGIALIFVPFNQEIPWNKRPTWQKAWLLIHLAVAAGNLGYGFWI